MVRIEPILLDGERWGQGAFPDMIAVVLTSSKEYFATGLYMGYPLIHVPKDSMYSTSRVRVIEGKEKEKVKFLRTSFTILIDASKDKVSKVIDALLSIANMRLHSLQPEDFIKALRRDVYYTVARCLGGVKYREFRMGTVPAWGVPTLDSEFLVVFSAGGVLDSVVPRFWRERTDILEMLMMVFPWFNLSPMDCYDQAPMDFGHIDYCLSFSSTPLPGRSVATASSTVSSLCYELRFAFCIEREDKKSLPIEEVKAIEEIVPKKMEGAAVWYIDTPKPKVVGIDIRPPYELEEVKNLLMYCLFRLSTPKEKKEVLECPDLAARLLVTDLSI